MLRRLREDGLIDVEESQFRLLDRGALAALADFDEAYLAPRTARQDDAFPAAGFLPGVETEAGVRPG